MADEILKRDNNRQTVGAGVGNDASQEIIMDRHDTTTKRKMVDSINEEIGHDAVGELTKSVSTAGTAVQIDSNSCKRAFVQAMEDNSGVVVIGGSAVVAAQGTRKGLALYPSQGQWFVVSNTNLLYIDSTQDGDTVTVFYEN